jgi:hypothetical protein
VIPPDTRSRPGTTDGERDMLVGFLERFRETLVWKCAELLPEQLATRSVPPSPLSLLGLVRHLAEVEGWWWRTFAGEPFPKRYVREPNPQGAFTGAVATADAVTDAWDYWRTEVAHAREIVAAHELDDVVEFGPPYHKPFSMRWILVHLIEEYARHCGHADFLRERIDGVTGD